MAAPTNVRVEANSQATTTVRWTYSGSAQIAVYRSTNGTDYTEITSAGNRVAVSTTSYEDTGLSTGTKYWYKLTDDLGSTFSDVVTVWTHGCAAPTENIGVALPRFAKEADPTQLNDMAQTVESALNKNLSELDKTCDACISDGALTIDCGCAETEVVVDQDVNSISILNCEDKGTNVTFIIPPNTTRGIGGWPKGMGFTGDEGFTSPISGGSSGRSINEFVNRALNINSRSGRSKPGTTTTGGKQGGASTISGECQCVPGTNGELTIKVCKPDGSPNTGNSLNCSAATKGAKLVACGGRGPYTWGETGSLNLSATSGGAITVTPPTNTGSAVAGGAYWITCFNCLTGNCSAGVCAAAIRTFTAVYFCDDSWEGDPDGCDTTVQCDPTPAGSTQNKCCSGSTNQCSNLNCIDLRAGGCTGTILQCDKRTAQMIIDGCNPCGLAAAGATVTVTDALGTQTTIIMSA